MIGENVYVLCICRYIQDLQRRMVQLSSDLRNQYVYSITAVLCAQYMMYMNHFDRGKLTDI